MVALVGDLIIFSSTDTYGLMGCESAKKHDSLTSRYGIKIIKYTG